MVKIGQKGVLANGGSSAVGLPSLDTSALPCHPIATYQKRAGSKFFSLPLAKSLAEHAKWIGNSQMEKSYRNSFYCSDTIEQENGQLTTKYCGNRWCLTCNRIRTARAIEAYKPVIESWPDGHEVTLTRRNVSAAELPATFGEMRKAFSSCLRAIRRTHGLEVVAVRKTECTYNIDGDNYHPHFHIIINGQRQAELLKELWLIRLDGWIELPDGTLVPRVTKGAQKVKRCGDRCLHELFKYYCKLTFKTKDKRKRTVPIAALHTIFTAMRGRRVWQPCGFTLPKEVEESIEGETIEVEGAPAFKRLEDQVYWQWDQKMADWVDVKTGELLSEYAPSDRFRELVDTIGEIHLTLTEGSPTRG